jgi:hypothetical protein
VKVGNREQACEGKKAHPTKQEAETHRRRLIRNGAHPISLKTYRCDHCGSWHVGHRGKPRRKRL